jgi:hypothetical protein
MPGTLCGSEGISDHEECHQRRFAVAYCRARARCLVGGTYLGSEQPLTVGS